MPVREFLPATASPSIANLRLKRWCRQSRISLVVQKPRPTSPTSWHVLVDAGETASKIHVWIFSASPNMTGVKSRGSRFKYTGWTVWGLPTSRFNIPCSTCSIPLWKREKARLHFSHSILRPLSSRGLLLVSNRVLRGNSTSEVSLFVSRCFH